MPARYNRVKKALRKLGITVHERKARGSHVVINDDQGRVYTLPCHQGERTMLSDVYLRALCRCFDLDYEKLRKNL
jgi:predicted RNA binding protein YcfA (HicA-like mRNA interferase family)